MATIKLKNLEGAYQTYTGVNYVTFNDADGNIVTFEQHHEKSARLIALENMIADPAYSCNTKVLSNGQKLVSINNQRDTGVWLMEEYDAVQVYSSGYYWNTFNETVNGCFITCSTNYQYGLLYYNKNTKECTLTSGSEGLYSWLNIAGMLFYSSSGSKIYLYNEETNAFTICLNTAAIWTYRFISSQLPSKVFVSSDSASYPGLYVIDINSGETVQLNAMGYRYNSYMSELTGYLIFSGYSATDPMIVYSIATQSDIASIAPGGRAGGSNTARLVSNNYIVVSTSSTSSTYAGCYVVNISSGTITKVYASGNSWSQVLEVTNGFLISSTVSSVGLLFYNTTTNEITRPYTSGASWFTLAVVVPGIGALLSSNSTLGMLFFNETTAACTLIFSTGYWNTYANLTEEVILAGSAGVIKFIKSSAAVTQLITATVAWQVSKLSDIYASYTTINATATGLYIYQSGGTVTQYAASGYGFNTLVIINNVAFISSAGYSNGLYCLNLTTGAVSTVTTSYYGITVVLIYEGYYLAYAQSSSMILVITISTLTLYNTSSFNGFNRYFEVAPHKATLLGSNTASGVLVFNSLTGQISNKYSNGNGWSTYTEVTGGYLITNAGTTYDFADDGILFYDIENNVVLQKYSKGTGWSIFTEDETGMTISRPHPGLLPSVHWDTISQSITEI